MLSKILGNSAEKHAEHVALADHWFANDDTSTHDFKMIRSNLIFLGLYFAMAGRIQYCQDSFSLWGCLFDADGKNSLQ